MPLKGLLVGLLRLSRIFCKVLKDSFRRPVQPCRPPGTYVKQAGHEGSGKLPFAWMAEWLDGLLVGWVVGWPGCRMAGRLGWMGGGLADGWVDGRRHGWRLDRWTVAVKGCMAEWLEGWLDGCTVGGWVAGWWD